MIEPVFTRGNEAALPRVRDIDPMAMEQARLRALLWRATNLAIESAFRFGNDLPVGAVAAADDWMVGRYFASDQRNGYPQMHAEYMAVMDAQMNRLRTGTELPDTVVVTLEPCDECQDFLATVPGLKRVGFGIARKTVSDLGLVKPHDETIFQRALRVGLPYEVLQIDDSQLVEVGRVTLGHTMRDPVSGQVSVNRNALQEALVELNG